MKVEGEKEVIGKIDLLLSNYGSAVKEVNEDILEYMDYLAMKRLKSLSKRWGRSWNPIFGSQEITTGMGHGHIKSTLTYNSPHASIVELGGMGTVLVQTAEPYYTVGAEQGELKGEYTVVSEFPIQKGYNYLGSAKDMIMYSFYANTRNRYLEIPHKILG
jgi:hypothetical protein